MAKKKDTSEQEYHVPDVSGENPLLLSKSEIDRIAEEISKKASESSGCSVCGNEEWQIYPYLLTAVTFDIPGDMHRHNRVTPLIMAICNNCGNTNQFMAAKYGITTKGGEGKKGGGLNEQPRKAPKIFERNFVSAPAEEIINQTGRLYGTSSFRRSTGVS